MKDIKHTYTKHMGLFNQHFKWIQIYLAIIKDNLSNALSKLLRLNKYIKITINPKNTKIYKCKSLKITYYDQYIINC